MINVKSFTFLAVVLIILGADAAGSAVDEVVDRSTISPRGTARTLEELRAQERATREAAEPVAHTRALIELGEALRNRGQVEEARAILSSAAKLSSVAGRSALEAAARGALGSLYASIGDNAAARLEISEALRLSEQSPANLRLQAALYNNLGSVEAEGDDWRAALDAFDAAAALAHKDGDTSLRLRAAANKAVVSAQHDSVQSARIAFDRARALCVSLKPSQSHVLALLEIVRAGRTILARSDTASPVLEDAIRSDLRQATQWAREIGDPAALSWAIGYSAEVTAEDGDVAAALDLHREALRQAQLAGIDAAALRWYARIGRLEQRRGRIGAAIDAFRNSADLQQRLRQTGVNGAAFESGIQVANVPLELVDLLLQRAGRATDAKASEADLLDAQRVLEQMKMAELRDYFHDECVDAYRSKIKDPVSAAANALVIHPVILPDRLVLLLSDPSGIRQIVVPVDEATLVETIHRFRLLLVNKMTRQYLRPAQELYRWIIAPMEADLARIQPTTLVFVPGGSLRTIPMAALHDGKEFLIERYALATLPGLSITDPRPMDRSNIELFLGGVSEAVQGFPALPMVSEELRDTRNEFGGELLLNSAFREADIERALAAREFSLVHVSTHAQFGSTSDETYLLTWDGRITIDELAEFVGAFRYRETPLDMIILSACETAAGDDRAALGLAGMAIRSGARSAIASLWSVDDAATSMLIQHFYEALLSSNLSRADALQRAQLALLHDRNLRHPANWAAFLLISNWL